MLTSSKNILTETPRIMFEQIYGHLVVQSSRYIKVTITRLNLDFRRFGNELDLGKQEEEESKMTPKK